MTPKHLKLLKLVLDVVLEELPTTNRNDEVPL